MTTADIIIAVGEAGAAQCRAHAAVERSFIEEISKAQTVLVKFSCLTGALELPGNATVFLNSVDAGK